MLQLSIMIAMILVEVVILIITIVLAIDDYNTTKKAKNTLNELKDIEEELIFKYNLRR